MQVKSLLRNWAPPAIVRTAKRLRAAIRGSNHPGHTKQQIEILTDVELALYQRSRQPFYVPALKLRYSGGRAFSMAQHHFIKYYRGGRAALERFYTDHQPVNIAEEHFVCGQSTSAGLDTLPWAPAPPEPFRGEPPLDHTHGRQQHGPVSQKKIDLEVSRLDNVRKSIERRGFVAELGGYPRGYFLENDAGDKSFIVVGGQHRVAAMIDLGFDPVPVIFQPDWPRMIRRTDAEKWPMVKKGVCTLDEALKIFDCYFRDPNLPLMRKP